MARKILEFPGEKYYEAGQRDGLEEGQRDGLEEGRKELESELQVIIRGLIFEKS